MTDFLLRYRLPILITALMVDVLIVAMFVVTVYGWMNNVQ